MMMMMMTMSEDQCLSPLINCPLLIDGSVDAISRKVTYEGPYAHFRARIEGWPWILDLPIEDEWRDGSDGMSTAWKTDKYEKWNKGVVGNNQGFRKHPKWPKRPHFLVWSLLGMSYVRNSMSWCNYAYSSFGPKRKRWTERHCPYDNRYCPCDNSDPYETLFEMNAVVIWLLFSSTTEDASVRKWLCWLVGECVWSAMVDE